jgi:hypothetical protein
MRLCTGHGVVRLQLKNQKAPLALKVYRNVNYSIRPSKFPRLPFRRVVFNDSFHFISAFLTIDAINESSAAS